MEEEKQVNMEEWLKKEEESINTPSDDFERLPWPAFEDGKITKLSLNFSEPIEKWTDPENKKRKAIIPGTTIDGTKIKWWLNLKNPIYKEVIKAARASEDKKNVLVSVLQTGKQKNTKYSLIKE